jgi:hypothetical protein
LLGLTATALISSAERHPDCNPASPCKARYVPFVLARRENTVRFAPVCFRLLCHSVILLVERKNPEAVLV